MAAVQKRLRAAQAVEPVMLELLRPLPAQAPLMDVMRSAASLLAHWDADAADK